MSERLKGYAVVSAEGAFINIWDDAQFARENVERNQKWLNSKGQRVVPMIEAPVWQPIDTAQCDDRFALVRWKDGNCSVENLDHDSDPAWWKERGAVEWMEVPE